MQPRRKVLVLDDSEIVLDLVAMALEEAGYEVVTLTSPSELAAACAHETPDVALVDVGTPVMTTDELAEVVRRDVRCPVLLFSERSEDEMSRLVALAGASGAVRKGPDPTPLLRWIERLIPAARGASLEFDAEARR